MSSASAAFFFPVNSCDSPVPLYSDDCAVDSRCVYFGGGHCQDLMRQQSEDLGTEERHMGPEPPPPLWPEIEGGMPSLVPMTSTDHAIIARQRAQAKRAREAPYYMVDAAAQPEVMRWSDRQRGAAQGRLALSKALASSARFVPPELLASGNKSAKSGGQVQRRGRSSSLSGKELKALEEIEGAQGEGAQGGPGGPNKGQEGEAGADAEETIDEAEDEAFDADYVENHYDSAGEDDDGGDDGGGDYL